MAGISGVPFMKSTTGAEATAALIAVSVCCERKRRLTERQRVVEGVWRIMKGVREEVERLFCRVQMLRVEANVVDVVVGALLRDVVRVVWRRACAWMLVGGS